MNILVLNCGSSSVKYQLIDMEGEEVLARGVVERIGIEDSFLKHKTQAGEEFKIPAEIPDHHKAVEMVIAALLNEDYGVVKSVEEMSAIGHRTVHGGEDFADSCLITDEVIEGMESLSHLAPLHNPHNLTGIRVCQELMPGKPMVAVFDTSFHQTMPRKAFLYGLPYEYYQELGVRRYGFHGTSHKYVTQRAAALLERPLEELKIISCHLGNGASIAAVDGGRSVDTSMGLTPLEGLLMGTRCGDIDPGIIPFLMREKGLSIDEIDDMMNKESGLYGVSGISSDSRDIEAAAAEGEERALVALDIFNYRVAKYIGSYMVAMGGVDAIVFTAGIGENQASTREFILNNLEFLDVYLDSEANQVRGREIEISTPDSRINVFVIPTNEELMIARDTSRLVFGE